MPTDMAITTAVAKPVQIILDYAQEVQAHATGFSRCTQMAGIASHKGRYNTKLNYHEFIAENAEAAGSEIAVAQYFGLRDFRPTVNTFKEQADVAAQIEVKWTKYSTGHLIVSDRDRIQDIAILVVGKSPVYIIIGWMPVAWAKKTRYLNNQDGNYWVSQADLMPMHTLRRSNYGSTEV